MSSIEQYVPHRPPMLLLDELVEHGPDHVVCAVTIRPDSMFAQDGVVPAWVALEYCAQSVAVFAGVRARADGRPPKLGLLVGVQQLNLETDGFAAGETLLVHAHWEFGETQLGRFECVVRRAGEVVANASLSVYQVDDPPRASAL